FAQAKEAAKKTTCLSNTKQIAVSQLLYSHDYDDGVIAANLYLPSAPIAQQIAGSWVTTIGPYTKATPIFFCPSFTPSNLKKAMLDDTCDGTD
ncbi:hypothetical protein ABTP36_19170, partial [Acinetobacter baumannii]